MEKSDDPSVIVHHHLVIYSHNEAIPKSFVSSPDGDTICDIKSAVLQCDTLATCLFVINLDYVL